MGFLINLIISGLAVFITAYLLPGVHVENFLTALKVAIVMGIINFLIKPVLMLLTLPINLMTLGLFTFVINALLVLLVTKLVAGFTVNSFVTALIFSLVLSVVNWILHRFTK